MGANQLCSGNDLVLTEVPFLPKGLTVAEKNPTLTEQQQQFLMHLHQFPYKQVIQAPLLRAGTQYYQGILDANKLPCGKGIYHTQNHAIFVGTFKGRQTDPFLYYVLPNGTFFQGTLAEIDIENATFQDPQANIKYEGQLKQQVKNPMRFLPNGAGLQQGPDYKFNGIYQSGKRVKGRLSWTSNNYQCIYEGQFDQLGKFSGKGVLQEQSGKYTGSFLNGLKHGSGKYEYKSMLVYEGNYENGVKKGKGCLKNSDGSVSYEGQFRNGLPHGQGTAYMNNQPIKGNFSQGLPQQYQDFLGNKDNKSVVAQ